MKILIVGYGSIGKRHLKNLQKVTAHQIIILTKRKDLNALKNKKIKIFDSLNDCIIEKPDIAFITNETAYHIPIAIKLAKSGIHIFFEKPLSNSIKNVKKLETIVKKKKLITQMGCNLRFNESIKKIKLLIQEKTIGKIFSVKVECGTYLPDWHPYEDYKKGYAARDDLGGGVVLTCIHEIDYLYWFFGNVKEVFALAGKYSNLKIKADDLATIILKFKNNIIGEVHLDYFQRPDIRSCKIIGEKGTIYWNSIDNEVKLYNVNEKKWIKKYGTKKYDKNQEYVDEIIHFLDCVNKHKKSSNDLKQGIETLQIALSIIKSSKQKKMVKHMTD